VIKYLGSKRRLIPVLTELFKRSGARTALDLFTGTTRVAQAIKAEGGEVTAVDTARYSEVFSKTWIETDARAVDIAALQEAIDELNSLPGEPGYVTETFCVQSRFFQPHNGARIDTIRQAIENDHAGSELEPLLLTSLLLAADKVDSTTGLQMAYVKKWAPRSFKEMVLLAPNLLDGSGSAIRADAMSIAPLIGHVDFAYLDPPYNQHRYFTNYHVWETLVAWDQPEHYGVACKRIDSRDDATKSAFNRKREMPVVLRKTIAGVNSDVIVVSYNDESWVELDELRQMCSAHGPVTALAFDSKRYVGAQIGIHSPSGEKVGAVGRTRNLEYVVVAGPQETTRHMTEPFADAIVGS
jgi:adenine-specific DNA-methyltransferase